MGALLVVGLTEEFAVEPPRAEESPSATVLSTVLSTVVSPTVSTAASTAVGREAPTLAEALCCAIKLVAEKRMETTTDIRVHIGPAEMET